MKQVPKEVVRTEGKGPRHYGCQHSGQCARWATLQNWTFFNCGECPLYKAAPEEKPPEKTERKKQAPPAKGAPKPKDLPLCSTEGCGSPVMTRKGRGGGEAVVMSICRKCYRAKIDQGKIKAISGARRERKDEIAEAARRGIHESREQKGALPARESVVSQIRALRQYHLDEAERCMLAIKVMQGE